MGLRALFDSARDGGLALLLMGLRPDRLERLPDDSAREQVHELTRAVIEGCAGAGAWAVAREEDTWWVAAPGIEPKDSSALARALVEAARLHRLELEGRSPRLTISIGLAHASHRSAPSFEACLGVVREGLRVAEAAGGDRAVHSEVYATFVGRESGPAPEPELVRPAGVEREREVELPAAAAAPALRELPAPVLSPDASPAERELLERLHITLAAAARDGEALVRAEGEVARWLHERVEELHAEASREGDQRSPEEIDVLQRRLTKLSKALEDAEAEIDRLRTQLARGEVGLASIYRDVQGLSQDATFAELKREMMARLFEANVALRDLVARNG